MVSLAATSTRDLEELTRILENEVSRRLEQVPGVGAIELRGAIYREIRVDLDRDRLKAAGLTALEVERALEQENALLPGGNVKSGLADLYVRPRSEYSSLEEIRRTVVATIEGRPIRVQDVAEVKDSYEDVRWLSEVNGMPSISMGIQKQSGANTVEVAAGLREEVARINAERSDLHLTLFAGSERVHRAEHQQSSHLGSLGFPLGGAGALSLPAQPAEHRHHRHGDPHFRHLLFRAALFRGIDPESDDFRRAGFGGGPDHRQRHRGAGIRGSKAERKRKSRRKRPPGWGPGMWPAPSSLPP